MKNYWLSLIVGTLVSLPPVTGQGDQAPANALPGGDAAAHVEAPPGSRDQTSPAQNGSDASADASSEHRSAGPSEIDLPVDDSVKIVVEPLFTSNLVDRVLEPSTVTVKCADALSVQLFVVAVDCPYGGVALARPKVVASDNHAAERYVLRWVGKEANPYVKLFAVVRRQRAPYTFVRSRAMDLAVGGMRYAPASPMER